MGTFVQDVRFGIRMLAKNRGFTAVAVLTLALGIGANTAIFSAVNALLLNPYHFPDATRLVSVIAWHISGKNSGAGYRVFLDWREQNAVFEEMAIVGWAGSYTLTGQGEVQRIVGARTTWGFFRVLGIRPTLGRFPTAEEDKPGAPAVAVLSYPAWQQRFGGRPDILGQTMTLDAQSYTIIGVMPQGFTYPGIRTCEFYTALQEDPANSRMQHQYDVVARLKPDLSLERAQADMTTIAQCLERQYPETNTGWRVTVEPLRNALARDASRPVWLLSVAVGFVLLLACVNVASLLMARASGRGREIAVRASLGASRTRLIRQMLTESVLLSIAGGVLGLVFARWLMDVLAGAAPEDLALDATLRLDPTVLCFTLVLSFLTGIVFGLAPALYGSKTDLNSAIKGDANVAGRGRNRQHLLSTLIVGEAALSLILLVGAGLLVKDLFVLLHLDTGLRVEHVLTFALDLPWARYSTPQRRVGFYADLLARLRAMPGVDGAAGVDTLPMTGSYSGGPLVIEDRPKPADWMDMETQYNSSTPGYFRALGIPILHGRDFDEHDSATSLPVAIVNDAFARRFFPQEDPLGHRVKGMGDWHTIVGVVASYKHQQPMQAPVPMLYVPHAQSPAYGLWITLRGTGDPAKLVASTRDVVRTLDRDVPLLKVRTMRQVVADSLSQPRLITSLVAGFGLFAVVLAAIGIYGVTAYSVSQRTHEMGIRFALGAAYSDVLGLVLRRGAGLVCVGVALGVPLALGLSRFMRSYLYGIAPRDVSVFAGVPIVLLAVALAASYLPARRAAKVDPIVALRYE